MGYYFYYPLEYKNFVARYAEFFETSLIKQEASGSTVDFDKIQSEDAQPSENTSLHQHEYVIQLLERAHMVNYNPSRTLVDTESKLGPEGIPVHDPTLYSNLAGGLQYLTFTRPGLSYAVQQIFLYMHNPRESHLVPLNMHIGQVAPLYDGPFLVIVFLGDNLLSWSSKRQQTLSRSSVEAEYRGVANVVVETAWLCNLLRELHSPLSTTTLVYYNNVRVLHVPFRYQYADIFTNGLPSALFEEFRSSLSVRLPLAPTAGEY
ncbi:ribonuclease H-like domain-containing protein [Tanacetum coccineum]